MRIFKQGLRVAAFATAPLRLNGSALIVSVVGRQGMIEGILSDRIRNKDSATRVIARMLNRSKFKNQECLIVTNGIAVAGLNIIDPEEAERLTRKRLIMITRHTPSKERLKSALVNSKAANLREKIGIVSSKKIRKSKQQGFFIFSMHGEEIPKELLDTAVSLLRIAHMVARGVATGESKGRI